MTVIAERTFTVTVKVEAPSIPALDSATAALQAKLEGAVPGRVDGLRVISKSVTRS